MRDVLITFLITGGVLSVYAVLQWLASLQLNDASIVDRFWGMGFFLVGMVALLINGNATPRALLLLAMVALWAIRLSIYITWRNWGAGEDYRYKAMRQRRGAAFRWTSLFMVFGLQAALTWFISMPIQILLVHDAKPLGWPDAIGFGIWMVGFLFESVGDWQLARFKSNPSNTGRPLDRGLWRYTRHPNYFGDALVWWGVFVVTLSVPAAAYAILSPVLMTYLLLNVSGVALLESNLRKSKPGYDDYIQRTSAFIPWFPRSHSR